MAEEINESAIMDPPVLTDEQSKLVEIISNMEKDGVPEDVIKEKIPEIQKEIKTEKDQENFFGKLYPEVKIKAPKDPKLTKTDLEKDEDEVVKKGRTYYDGLNITFTDAVSGAEVIEVDNNRYKVGTGPSVRKPRETVVDELKNIANQAKQNKTEEFEGLFDGDMYDASHDYAYNNQSTIANEDQTGFLDVSELSGEQMLQHRDDTFDQLMGQYHKTPEGQDAVKSMITELEIEYEKIRSVLLENIASEKLKPQEALLEFENQSKQIKRKVLENNDSYMTAVNTNSTAVGSVFNRNIAVINNDEAVEEIIPWYVKGDFLEGIWEQAALHIPKASKVIRRIGLSKDYRAIVDYKTALIEGTELPSLSGFNLDTPQEKNGKVYFPGTFSLADADLSLVAGYYDKEPLLDRLKMMEKNYNKKILKNIIATGEYQDKISKLTTDKAYQSLNGWQKEMGKQMMNMVGGIFTGGMYTYALEGAGAYEEMVIIECQKRYPDWNNPSWANSYPENENGVKSEYTNKQLGMIAVIEDGSVSESIEDMSTGVGLANAGLEIASDGFIIFKASKLKIMPAQLFNEIRKGYYVNAIKQGGNIAKMMAQTTAIEVPTEIFQEATTKAGVYGGTGYFNIEKALDDVAEVFKTTILTAPALGGSVTTVVNTAQNTYDAVFDMSSPEAMTNTINREIEKLQKETQVFDEAYQRQLDVLNKTNELLRSEEYGGLAWTKDPEAKLVIKEKLKNLAELDIDFTNNKTENKRIKEKYGEDYKETEAYKNNKQQLDYLIDAEKNTNLDIARAKVKAWKNRQNNETATKHNQDPNSDRFYKVFNNNKDLLNFLEIEYGVENLDPSMIEGITSGEANGIYTGLEINGRKLIVVSQENTNGNIDKMDASLLAGNVFGHEDIHADMDGMSNSDKLNLINKVQDLLLADPEFINLQIQENILRRADATLEYGVDFKVVKGKYYPLSDRGREEYIPYLSDAMFEYRAQDFSKEGIDGLNNLKNAFQDVLKTDLSNADVLSLIREINRGGVRTGYEQQAIDWFLDKDGNPLTYVYNDIDIISKKTALMSKSSGEIMVDSRDAIYGKRTNQEISAENKNIQDLMIVNRKNPRAYTKLQGDFLINNAGVILLNERKWQSDKDFVVSKDVWENEVFGIISDLSRTYKPLLTELEFNEIVEKINKENEGKEVKKPLPKKEIAKDVDEEANIVNPVNFGAYLQGLMPLRIRKITIDATKILELKIKEEKENKDLYGGTTINEVLDVKDAIANNQETSEIRETLGIVENEYLYDQITLVAAETALKNVDKIDNSAKFESAITKDFKADWRFLRETMFPEEFNDKGKRIRPLDTDKYKEYVEKRIRLIYRVMPVAEVTKLKLGLTEAVVLDAATGRIRQRVNESKMNTDVNISDVNAGNVKRIKLKLTPELEAKLVDAFLNPEDGRLDMSQERFLRYLSNLVMRDAVITGLKSPAYIDKYGEADSLIKQVAQVIGKNIDFKFSSSKGPGTIYANMPNFVQRATNVYRQVVNMNFASGNIDGIHKFLDTIEKNENIKNFVARIFDEDFHQNQESIAYKKKVINLGDQKLNNFIVPSKKKGGQGALKYNETSLESLQKAGLKIAKKVGPDIFNIIGYDILGYHYRALDAAENKVQTIDGKRVKMVDSNGNDVTGDYYEKLQNLKNSISKLNVKLPKGLILDDVRFMNPSSPLWNKINKITKNGSLNKQQKLEALKKLNPEIQKANIANIKLLEFFVNNIKDLYTSGKLKKLDVYNLLQIQTDIQKGFRSLSKLDYITIKDGSYEITKGEHIKDNASTMYDVYAYIIGETNVLNLDSHTQWAAEVETTKIMDKPKDVDLKNSPVEELRFTFLPQANQNNVYGPDGRKLSDIIVEKQIIKELNKKSLFSKSTQGVTILDFDDTLATTKSKIRFTKPDGTTGSLNAEQYAKNYQDLTDKGYVWDFSEFNDVVEGKIAPLFNKALKLQGKFGTQNMFVLTARPAAAQAAIHAFLKANGLNIPLENITGLGNSTSEAKALWIADKVAQEGYNDVYFADDAEQNVQAVENILDQMGVKRKTTLADPLFSLSTRFNTILEQTKGVAKEKEFSDAQGRIRGTAVDKYKILPIMPSAQDFKGLLYSFLSKGELGEQQLQFFEDNLIRPYVRGTNKINETRQQLKKNYQSLIEKLPKVKVKLTKLVDGTNYSHGQAVRVYLWNKNGMTIPGISKRDEKLLVKTVNSDPSLITFANGLSQITQQENGYLEPSEYWTVESIASDLYSLTGKLGRKDFLAKFIENRNEIFGELDVNGRLQGPNAAKIEAIYGSKFREALEDMLYRMEYGRNKSKGKDRITSNWDNWVNGSVGTIMFFNMRSAVLQLISATNYIDTENNSPFAAAKAFAENPKYWVKTAVMLFNSPFIQERLSGESRTINEAELAAYVQGSENKLAALGSYLLKIGFGPTRVADMLAILLGGTSYYINQEKAYLLMGYSKKEAAETAMTKWIGKTQESQQSSDAMMISQQQAGGMGRLILAFKNTPMQYARLIDKAVRDIKNGRGSTRANLSKIAYYGFVQNVMFNMLQQALWKAEAEGEELSVKEQRMINGMIDSLLNGLGLGGNIVATLKNGVLKYNHEEKKGWNADHTYTILQLANLSPTIGSKLRKIYGSIQSKRFNEEVIKEMPYWNLGNPAFDVMANLVSGLTNIPLDRAVNKIHNLMAAADSETEFWDSFALVLGWNVWDLGIETEARKVKKELKEKKKAAKKQCTAIKSKGGRCKNKTTNKSGKCYAHDK